ncbi:MAG: beta galactosidase jelly roll domain-containing protein, partial [Phaeodactylibacter sp.]|nr:beta galactosidase jelly roll domain-containing protein [Phaeodactylibacter sp.]
GDNMVLQRDATVKVWGWADPGEAIRIEFYGQTKETAADAAGNWAVQFADLKAGGPYTMQLQGKNTIQIQNILIGDVWLCGGQSNMETTMERVSPRYPEELKNAEAPHIRYFYVPRKYDFNTAQADVERGNWEPISQKNIRSVSAVAYFFAQDLHAEYGVPIGLINNALGGSPAQSWVDEQTLKAFPDYYAEAQRFKDREYVDSIIRSDTERQRNWYQKAWQEDAGYQDQPWHAAELNTEGWSTMSVPGYWADTELGAVNGVLWFRKEIDLPAALAGKPARLLLGRVVDADSTYVNGHFVGTVSYQYPPRRYEVPANVLKAGKNTITVRVINNAGRGGFFLDKPYELIIGDESIELKGDWQYKLGAALPPLQSQTFVRWKALGLYNAMLHPLFNFRIKGVIWYQGESNTWNPAQYADLFPALIQCWRRGFGQQDLPFLFVQLANFMKTTDEPVESNWAALRDAQRKALSLPNTAMAVAIDVGEWNDIHPLNKKDVGHRLALAARKVAYGDGQVVYAGPLFESMTVKKGKAVLRFSSTGSGLMAKGDTALQYFAIAGADGQYHWATAKIKGDRVVVYHAKVPNPVAVRYAWADNPEGANLYNKEGLPASPFEAKVE